MTAAPRRRDGTFREQRVVERRYRVDFVHGHDHAPVEDAADANNERLGLPAELVDDDGLDEPVWPVVPTQPEALAAREPVATHRRRAPESAADA